MTDKKDDPGAKAGQPKASETGPAQGTGAGAAKRPFATIDLKAVEVAPAATGSPAAASGAKPAAAQGQAEAAQKIAGAAGAQKPQGASDSGLPVTGARGAGEKATGDKGAAEKGGTTQTSGPAATAGADRPRAAPMPPPAPTRRAGGFLSHTLAGIVGGVLAFAGAPVLAPLLTEIGLPPAPALAPEVAQRIAALERSAAAKPQVDPAADPARAIAATEANRKRLDELAAALAGVREAQSRTAALAGGIEARLTKEPPIADAAERLVALEKQMNSVAAIAKTDPNAGRIAQVAQLTGRLADVESALTSRMTALRKEVQQDVDARLVPTTEASETARSGTQRLDRDVIALKAESNRIATGLDQVRTSTDRLQLALKVTQDEAAATGARLDGFRRDVEGRLTATAKPADVSSAVAPLASKVTALEQSMTGVVRSEGERKATAERIVLSLELGNLKRAMERGTPYAQELAEVRKVAGNRIDLAPLEPYRNEGVPTLAELARNFRPMANALLDAERDKADGSVVDRLMSGAKTFVRVRKTAHAAGDTSAEAVVARMEAALKAGRLADVLAEAKTVAAKPPAAGDWLAKVAARQTVDAALADIDAALKSSLGAGPAEAPAAQKKAAP